MKDIGSVLGAEQLVAVFGYWPSFHDAELLWLRLDRQSNIEDYYGPTLETLVHAFERTSDVGADGCYVLRHHVLVHLRFSDVVELQLEGFNHQNALTELSLTDLRDRHMEQVKWSVRFESAFGVDSSFQCHAVEVISVVPCDSSGKPK